MHQHIETILIAIVLISVLPIAIEFLRARSKSKKEGGSTAGRPVPDTAPETGGRGRHAKR